MCLKRVQLLYQRSYYKASTGHSLQAAILSITAARLLTQVVGIIHQGRTPSCPKRTTYPFESCVGTWQSVDLLGSFILTPKGNNYTSLLILYLLQHAFIKSWTSLPGLYHCKRTAAIIPICYPLLKRSNSTSKKVGTTTVYSISMQAYEFMHARHLSFKGVVPSSLRVAPIKFRLNQFTKEYIQACGSVFL